MPVPSISKTSGACLLATLLGAGHAQSQKTDEPPPVHQVRPESATPAAAPPLEPADLPPATPLPYRFVNALGLHVDLANEALAGFGNEAGVGLHFTALAAPPDWPVLLGMQLGLETYGGPARGGRKYVLTSYYVLAAVRLQPDRWSVRPRVELLGGLWGLDLGTPGSQSSAIIDARYTVGGRATFGYGGAVGVDFILGREEAANYGLGLGVQLLGGGNMTLPDPYGPGQRESSAIGQLMFLLDLVAVSRSID